MQNEITQPGPLLDSDGRLAQVGWSRQPLLECNLEKARFYTVRPLQRFRIKRWDYYAIFTPRRFFSATIADLGYAGNIFVYTLDFATGDLHEDGLVIPLGRGIQLERHSTSGETIFSNRTPGQQDGAAMSNQAYVYIPQDRLRALARAEVLPDHHPGCALFADISGFTPLSEALAQAYGARRGAEELLGQLNRIFQALIAEVDRSGGSVISFAGDAITCWFGEAPVWQTPSTDFPHPPAALQAVTCALGMQAAMSAFESLPVPGQSPVTVSLKVAIASGPARRFLVGDPQVQLIDALAGATLARMAAGEHLARRGDILVDEFTLTALERAWMALGRQEHWTELIALEDIRTSEDGIRFAALTQTVVERFHLSDLLNAFPSPAEDYHLLSTRFVEHPQALQLLRPYVLPEIWESLQTGQGEFLAELRPVSVMFVNFEGIDYDGDEEAGVKLDQFIRQVQAIVQRLQGHFLQLNIGDKGSYLYLSFGAPVAHEDDARRAAAAALELCKASSLTLHIGISQGVIWTGAYGGSTRRTYGVLGDDVNLSARLMGIAAPGEILVSGRIYKALSVSFSFEPRPPLPLKGKAEPLPVFALTGARLSRPVRLQEPNYALPMVGRQAEIQKITEKMELASQGQGQVIGITSEAGMGKSRLVAEVIRLARRNGFVGYGGACQSDGINTPYLPWRSIWNAFFRVDPDLPQRKLMRHLEGEIEDRAPERLDALPLLGLLLGLDLPENDFTRGLEPKYRKTALHSLLEDCLRSAASEAPLLLVIEDLHWIDALSHDLLEDLAHAALSLPVLIVLAYRPPQLLRLQAPRIEALPHFTQMALTELSAMECEQVVRARLAQLYPARAGGLPPGLAEQLAARAQGNPFYLEELLNYLHDRGIDLWSISEADSQGFLQDLPDSLHALILSRIDQLTEREKTTLKVASVIGRAFRAAWMPGYYPLLGTLIQVKTDLDRLGQIDITPLDTPEPELVYLFKHIVTHEVTYESLPYATRAQLHEKLGGFLETYLTETGAPLDLDALAYHYGCSQNQAKQCEYYQKAGDAAKAAYANDAALNYYERLLPLLVDPQAQADVQFSRGAVLERTGKWQEAEVAYHAALALSEQNSNRLAVVNNQRALGVLCRLRGDYGAALDWLERARTGEVDDPLEQAKTRVETGIVYLFQGDYALSREHLQAGETLARACGDLRTSAQALHNLGNIAYYEGNYPAARVAYDESLALRRELGDKTGIAASLNGLGNVASNLGDMAAARAFHEESLALRRGIGDKQGIAASLNNLGNVALNLGDFSQARSLYEQSLALHRELGSKPAIATLLINVGNVALNQGDYAAARLYDEEGLALKREIGDKQGVAWSLIHMGLVALVQNDPSTTRARCEESLALSREIGFKQGIAWSLSNLGYAAVNQGYYAEGRAYSNECVALSREIGDQYALSGALGNLGAAALNQGDYAAARTFYEENLTLSREISARPSIAWSLTNLGAVALNQGDAAAARTQHEESLAIFQEIGEKRGVAWSLNNLGSVALSQGDYALTRQRCEESLALGREIGDKQCIAQSLNLLGNVAEEQGNYSSAQGIYQESLKLYQGIGDRQGIAVSLVSLASTAAGLHDMPRAARLASAAETLRLAMEMAWAPSTQRSFDRTLRDARSALSEADFTAAWSETEKMTLDECIGCALTV